MEIQKILSNFLKNLQSQSFLGYKEQLIGLDHKGGRKFTFLKYNGNF
jgi:hypothetical protein